MFDFVFLLGRFFILLVYLVIGLTGMVYLVSGFDLQPAWGFLTGCWSFFLEYLSLYPKTFKYFLEAGLGERFILLLGFGYFHAVVLIGISRLVAITAGLELEEGPLSLNSEIVGTGGDLGDLLLKISNRLSGFK